MFAIDMKIFYEGNGDAFEGKDTTLYLLLFLFVLLSFKFDLAVSHSSASLSLNMTEGENKAKKPVSKDKEISYQLLL